MRFNRNPKKITQKEQATKSAFESLDYLYRTIMSLEVKDPYSIKLLALELRKLLTDNKKIDNKTISVFDYVFDSPKFPEVYSVEDRIEGDTLLKDEALKNNDRFEEIGLDHTLVQKGVNFASSLASLDGVYKPVIKPRKFVSSREWLSTNVLVLSNEGQEAKFISIENIIKDIGNKESAHIDVDFVKRENQRYSLLERLDERYDIVIGLVELVLATFDNIMRVNRLSIISLDLEKTGGVVRYKEYVKDNPIRMDYFISFYGGRVNAGGVFSYARLRAIRPNEQVRIFGYGDDFSVCVDDENQIYMNNKGQKTIISKIDN